MKLGLSNALERFPIAVSSESIFRTRRKYAIHVMFNQNIEFPRLSADWIPTDNAFEELNLLGSGAVQEVGGMMSCTSICKKCLT